jgi:transcriptional regulator with GAF, ATPase, and Fis domain
LPGGKLQDPRPDELEILNPESLAALPTSARLARSLQTILKISTAVGTLRDVDAVKWQLLGMVFDVIPAERGAILLFKSATEEIASIVSWDRALGPESPIQVRPEITRRALEERAAVLENEFRDNNLENSPHYKEGESGESVLCAPLISATQVLGVIYVNTVNAKVQFAEADRKLLGGIAGLVAVAIENARLFEGLTTENRQLRAEAGLQHDMVGQSARMRQVYQFIERVAPSDATVLITGESGTGKELVARAMHKNSARKDKSFVALNCAAVTETLLESELFGHEKGAFTSAIGQKKGMLEVAEGGTVFLDEVGELPLTMQAKLLRVLQEREFVRVGGTRAIRLDVRFLAATNRDLQKEVVEGRFRGDLFHRLNVIALQLPALREHAEDIPMLAEHFVTRFAQKCNRGIRGISPEANACLMQYDWPGNIRELGNAMERAVVVGSANLILPEDLPETLLDSAQLPSTASAKYHNAVQNLKKQLILNSVEQAGGSFTEAAKLLGVHPNYLHRLVRNLNLKSSLKGVGR